MNEAPSNNGYTFVSGNFNVNFMPILKEKLSLPYFRYLVLVSLIGFGILVLAVTEIPEFEPLSIFFLLLALSITSQFSTSSFTVKDNTLTYQVSPAVAAAAVPFFGPFSSLLINAAAGISLWILKPANDSWKKSWEQLFFNVSTSVLSMFSAAQVYLSVEQMFPDGSVFGTITAWVLAAICADQISLWLVIGILWLSQPSGFRPLDFWAENRWAMVISITLFAVGGGILAFAIESFGFIGGAIFFLPIMLSSFAFRTYVGQMQSHLDNLEQIIDERTCELQQLMDEKDSFLAVLTHDMKTPLTSIGLYSDVLKMNPDVLSKKPEIADTIKRSQVTLMEIVKNILDLEKIRAGEGIPLDKEWFDVTELVVETVETVEMQARRKQIQLHHSLSPAIGKFEGDRHQVGRVLQNLLSNAVKYTPKGGHVTVNAAADGEYIAISICDTGYGIPAAELPYIFDRFHRVEGSQSRAAGTGLGLAITKALVEAHNGELSVRSEVGRGSEFTVLLPQDLSV